MKLIFIMFRSPHCRGRIGQTRHQDWYRALVYGINMFKMQPPGTSKILLVGDFCALGSRSEFDIYMDVIRLHGLELFEVIHLAQGQETESQLFVADRFASEGGYELNIIATWLHHVRIKWICFYKSIDARIKGIIGIPRPREFLTELFGIVLYPLLDVLGIKTKFIRWVTARRSQGKF